MSSMNLTWSLEESRWATTVEEREEVFWEEEEEEEEEKFRLDLVSPWEEEVEVDEVEEVRVLLREEEVFKEEVRVLLREEPTFFEYFFFP